MKVKHTDSELRAILVMHWKQKIKHVLRKHIKCSFENKFCNTCKESDVCGRIEKKPWVGKI
jgi:hypothetical protein